MPEVRLIDANALHGKMMDDAGCDFSQELNLAQCLLYIETSPTIEATPVRQGRWTKDGCDYKYFYYRCSVCGVDNDGRTKFCPNCGAKMENKEENNND